MAIESRIDYRPELGDKPFVIVITGPEEGQGVSFAYSDRATAEQKLATKLAKWKKFSRGRRDFLTDAAGI